MKQRPFASRFDVFPTFLAAAMFVTSVACWLPSLAASSGGDGTKPSKATTNGPASTAAGAIMAATKDQLAILQKFQKRLQSAGQVRSVVNRRTSIGLLGTEKRASGDLLVSQGRVRMDLKAGESDERQLLIVGDKAFWAVTYPPKEFKEAAVQVVTGQVKSKKSGSVGFLAMLGKDGFLKSFSVTGVGLDKDGGIRYYLQPKVDWVEAKRALLALGPDVAGERAFREIMIWDSQDNESQYTLEKVKFDKAKAESAKFSFSPPKNADVMSLQQ